MDKDSLKYKIFLTLAVLAITVVFFMIVPEFYDNSRAEYAYTLLEDGTVTIDGYTGDPDTLEVPAELDGYTVSALSNSAFANKSALEEVVLPDTLKVIGDYAFYNCTGIKRVEAPGVREVGYSAFYGCHALKEFADASSLVKIGDFAFASCTHLRSLTLPASCESIGTDAFVACESLILDCSQNELAAAVAEQYGIPTDFSESDDWLLLQVGLVTVGALVLVFAGGFLIGKRKQRKKIENNSQKI